MKNFEKYQEEILSILNKTSKIALKDNKPVPCNHDMYCDECGLSLSGGSCITNIIKWLYKEYEAPKIDLPADIEIDTPILVSDDGVNWFKRYFAKIDIDQGIVGAWNNGATSWSSDHMAVALTAWRYARLPEESEKEGKEL